MYIFSILIINLVSIALSFNFLTIEPETEFHNKKNSLLVKCNTTGISFNEHPILMYSYNRENYTLPRVNGTNSSIYIGNLTLSHPNQFKVNVLCIGSKTGRFFSSKIYFFGYSPGDILTGSSAPQLRCQDFNMMRIACCMSFDENEIAAKLGILDDQIGNLSILLYSLADENTKAKLNSSCFDAKEQVYTPTLKLTLFIKNDLGNISYDFSFERNKIFKPEAPNIFLSPISSKEMEISINVIDMGEFFINGTCSSDYPLPLSKNFDINTMGRLATRKLTGWIPYSRIICKAYAQILFGNSPEGQLSEQAISEILMPEAAPNRGPILSPALMEYETGLDFRYLDNVVLYFIDVLPIDVNGRITKYEFECDYCEHGYSNSGFVSSIEPDSRSIRLSRARIQSTITVSACNSAGCTKSPSTLRFIQLTGVALSTRIFLSFQLPDSINLMWYLKNDSFSSSESRILICLAYSAKSRSLDNDCSSIQSISLDNKLIGQKTISLKDSEIQRFAYVPALSGSGMFPIKWVDCINKISSIYEIQKKLSNLRFNRFVIVDNVCNWISCYNNIKIKIPSCENIPVVIIDGIQISYETRKGVKHIGKSAVSENEIELKLFDFEPSVSYQLNISIVTHDNQTILWYQHSLNNGWWAIWKLIVVFLIVVAITIGALFLLCKYQKKVRNKYFKKKYSNRCRNENIIKINSVKPPQLNNAQYVSNHYTEIGQSTYSPSKSSGINYESTDSTLMELGDSSQSSSSDSQKNENIIDTDIRNDLYVERPDIPKINESMQYIHLGMPIHKEKTETNFIPFQVV